MTLSGILSRSAAKNQIACICLFKINHADYIQCSSSLPCLPSEHQDRLLLTAGAQSGSEIQFSGATHFYFPAGYCFPHMILKGFLRWHFGQGYRKLVQASDCASEEWKLVCLHVVLGDNVGLLVLASEGSCGLTNVVRYIDRYVVIFNLVEHRESGIGHPPPYSP